MFSDWPILSLVIWVPILGGVLVLATGKDRNATEARVLALLFAVATFVVSLP
ncbi:MAG TPA: NADH-quinone oxidoreductase subunit M, partial [Gammaproteobacteria bacterium]|nr:NADH-quinone oxidoreductase subunit M [Gammaproteobacteria bacterium]